MIVTIDNNTRPVELYHLSILFQSLAKAHGFVAPVAVENVTSITIDPTPAQVEALREAFKEGARGELVALPDKTPVVNEAGHVVGTVTLNDPATIERVTGTDNGVSVGYVVTPVADIEANHADVVSHLDSSGLPWDARIHAGSRERNTDGSWRVRRRPKDTDQDAWDATLARVTAELTDLMSIPVSPGAVADAAAEESQVLTDAEVDAFVDIVQGITIEDVVVTVGGVVVEGYADGATVVVAPPVTIAPPVVVPPVTAVTPPITIGEREKEQILANVVPAVSAAPAIETFAQLMSWLTSRTPKDEAAKPAMVVKVNEILAANGLTTLQQLGQRAELIPQVLAQFRDAFGE